MEELPHTNYKGPSGGKVSVQKYVEESESGTQAIVSIFTKTLTTNNTTIGGQQEGQGQTITKTYNIHGAGENSNFY